MCANMMATIWQCKKKKTCFFGRGANGLSYSRCVRILNPSRPFVVTVFAAAPPPWSGVGGTARGVSSNVSLMQNRDTSQRIFALFLFPCQMTPPFPPCPITSRRQSLVVLPTANETTSEAVAAALMGVTPTNAAAMAGNYARFTLPYDSAYSTLLNELYVSFPVAPWVRMSRGVNRSLPTY